VTKRRNSLHKTSSGAINGPISRESDSKVVVGSSESASKATPWKYIPSCINSAAIMCHKSSECKMYARKGS
jgi:hypothetical protein